MGESTSRLDQAVGRDGAIGLVSVYEVDELKLDFNSVSCPVE